MYLYNIKDNRFNLFKTLRIDSLNINMIIWDHYIAFLYLNMFNTKIVKVVIGIIIKTPW